MTILGYVTDKLQKTQWITTVVTYITFMQESTLDFYGQQSLP